MIAYKGFERDLTCRGFQYIDGYTYISEGEPKKCHQGFHASIMPLHVLKYYNTETYRRVEIPNNCLDTHDVLLNDDSKICGSKISICKKPIYNLYVEQRKVMEYIVHTCAHMFGTSNDGRVPNWINLLRYHAKNYIQALHDYSNLDMPLNDSSGYRHLIYSKRVTANDLMSTVDCFWSILVCHFETSSDHKDFYDSIDKITCGEIDDKYYISTIRFDDDSII